jgi:hypothetical protein
MADIGKKVSNTGTDADFVVGGNTQGLLQAQTADFLCGIIPNITSNSNWQDLPLQSSGLRGKTSWYVGDDLTIRLPQGAYTIGVNCPQVNNAPTAAYVQIRCIEGEAYSPNTGGWDAGNFGISGAFNLYVFSDTARIKFNWYYNPVVTTTSTGFYTITKIETLVPVYANVKSGGALQIDEDGNGYTENYFESETQVGYYTRADGKKKPVYKTYFSGNISVAASTESEIILSTGNVQYLLGIEGSAQIGASSRNMDINSSRGNGGNYDYYFGLNQDGSNMSFISWSKYTRVSTANAYKIWVKWCKLSDAWE